MLYTVMFLDKDGNTIYPIIHNDNMSFVTEEEVFTGLWASRSGLRVFKTIEAAHKYVERSKAQMALYNRTRLEQLYAFDHYVVAAVDFSIVDDSHLAGDTQDVA